MRTKKMTFAAALVVLGLAVSACHDHPGYNSDRHGHHRGSDNGFGGGPGGNDHHD